MGASRLGKSNKSCSCTKHFQANDRLFFRKNWTCSNHNTTICLPVVFQEIRKTNRRRQIIHHHDNASSHTSAQTTAFLSTQNFELMSSPPYSADLAPNDFFSLKNKLRSQHFSTLEEAVDEFRMHLLEIPQSEW